MHGRCQCSNLAKSYKISDFKIACLLEIGKMGKNFLDWDSIKFKMNHTEIRQAGLREKVS